MKRDIGLIGLGVMGKSLALNMAGKGYSLSLFNRPEQGKGDHIAQRIIEENSLLSGSLGFEELSPFLNTLKSPRIIFIMIKAGEAVDQLLDSLKPFLVKGDVIIEGGNSHYTDTIRRFDDFSQEGIYFLGTGISGGEQGALKGPSIMAGGSKEGFEKVAGILDAIAAKDNNGNACMSFVGRDGAGHFAKMVHNGIEYGEMQIIADIYAILKDGLELKPEQIANTFEKWLHNNHYSFLLEITIDILRKKEDAHWVIDKIADQALAKGTGSWTVQAACDLHIPVQTIAAALFARYQSAFKNERLEANQLYKPEKKQFRQSTDSLAKAYQTARIINHHQGFHLIEAASKKYHWGIDLSSLAHTWTKGCIIQSELMSDLLEILNERKAVLSSFAIVPRIKAGLPHLAELVSNTAISGIATPALSASLNYMYCYMEGRSTANLIQAQRDYFGAHGIQWSDNPSGKSFHYKWLE